MSWSHFNSDPYPTVAYWGDYSLSLGTDLHKWHMRAKYGMEWISTQSGHIKNKSTSELSWKNQWRKWLRVSAAGTLDSEKNNATMQQCNKVLNWSCTLCVSDFLLLLLNTTSDSWLTWPCRDKRASLNRCCWWVSSNPGSTKNPVLRKDQPICVKTTECLHQQNASTNWVWVKIRYPNNYGWLILN